MPIRLLIADRDERLRNVVKQHLAPHGDIEVVASVSDATEMFLAIADTRPDVILLDPAMRGSSAFDHSIGEVFKTKLLIWSVDHHGEIFAKSLRAGATNFAVKQEGNIGDIASLVRRVAAGETVIDDQAAPAVATELLRINSQMEMTSSALQHAREALDSQLGRAAESNAELEFAREALRSQVEQLEERAIQLEFARETLAAQVDELKITYRTTGVKIDDLIASFRTSYFPRIVVTVDMIATGTDIKPLEIVFFMRSVRSRTFFEQMKGRGVRVISDTDLQAVTPNVKSKDHFIIVDAVGVCEGDKTDSRPLERKPTVSFEKLLQRVALGNRNKDVLTSLAGRLARLDRQCSPNDRKELEAVSGGVPLNSVVHSIIDAVDPDRIEETAKATFNTDAPTQKQLKEAGVQLANSAVEVIATKPAFRNKLVDLKKSFEQTIDTVSVDRVTAAGYDQAALDAARNTVQSFEQFIAENKDEITALEILYSQPRRRPLSFADIKALADAIEKPPHRWTPEALWRAYDALDRSKVRGASGQRLLTDMVSLVKFALQEEHTLRPYTETVNERFDNWLARQSTLGRPFTDEQIHCLELIRNHIATSLSIEADDFEFSPFTQKGGLGKAYQLFGPELPKVLEELNEVLAA